MSTRVRGLNIPHCAVHVQHTMICSTLTSVWSASAEEQIRSQMLKANSSSGGSGLSGGQHGLSSADASALLSDKLHTDTGMAGGVTVVEEPLGVAKAKGSTADQQAKTASAELTALDAIGTAAGAAAKAAGDIAAGGIGAAAANLGGKDACLPTKWTGNAADYKLTKCA